MVHVSDKAEELAFLLENQILRPVKKVVFFGGEEYVLHDVYLVEPEYIWKGEGWMRGVFDYEDGCVVFRKAWFPIIDMIKRLNDAVITD